MRARKRGAWLRWAGASALAVPLTALSSGCGDSDNGDAAGTGGTAAAGGSGGTAGSETRECRDVQAAPTLLAACEVVRQTGCPGTLDEFLVDWNDLGAAAYVVVEVDGLREIRTARQYDGHAFSFDEDGMLAGWESWNHSPHGPCLEFGYKQGRILGGGRETPPGVHRCSLATDALETGILCDCPCPEPPPENAIHDGPEACLSVPDSMLMGSWPRCAATIVEHQSLLAAMRTVAPMRAGCGVRTVTLDELDCAYDDGGMLLGGERRRGDEPRNECPGVDAYRSGAPPTDCADETICYLGATPPAGFTPCPSVR
jgi:hypothetical protein